MLSIAEVQAELAKIDQLRRQINSVLIAACQGPAPADTIKLIAAVTRAVATGGKDPLAIIDALNDLNSINADLTAAENAVKAQQDPNATA